ncbi:hypothetical protein CUJ84_Chr002253 [Rhizobium leguminosarum]|uniref:Uncharacterized protein n=1 Tax=Rhizobium leguminosarum TaxID=384 RepID=A0A2K9Z2Z5_RHILE|nr:hypothetical protein CUJ84_Chr002253 [Rhizobium leguminosarum]
MAARLFDNFFVGGWLLASGSETNAVISTSIREMVAILLYATSEEVYIAILAARIAFDRGA